MVDTFFFFLLSFSFPSLKLSCLQQVLVRSISFFCSFILGQAKQLAHPPTQSRTPPSLLLHTTEAEHSGPEAGHATGLLGRGHPRDGSVTLFRCALSPRTRRRPRT